ncbi:hypothetical protein B4U79_08254 [Dinothrombium tinctorium]|uniref:Uncharacterized protein n=1 Tax=Dinothrombium tinctorium TaxID=1965070 RepID=A0A3S3PW65_9ACAR|nr:hypothetical protein B4U79_08254 [Dinothrombium tinctorium]
MNIGCCDFKTYYCNQAGHGVTPFNIYKGIPYQKGYGLFSSYFSRYGIPLLKYLGSKVLSTGKKVATDIYLKNEAPKEAVKRRLKEFGRTTLEDAIKKLSDQQGAGIVKKRKKANNKKVKKSKKVREKKKLKDIFD